MDNIDWSDTGVYQCMASEAEHGLIEGDVAQLVVHSKPKNTGDFSSRSFNNNKYMNSDF